MENYIYKRYAPRFVILSIDLSITVLSLFFSYLLRFNFNLESIYSPSFKIAIISVIVIRTIIFLATQTYSGIVRYTGTKDAGRIFLIVLFSNFIICIANLLYYPYNNHLFLIPFSVIAIDFFVTVFLMTAFRLVVKTMYSEFNNLFKIERTIVIFGINENSVSVKRVLARDDSTNFQVIAYIDPENLNLKKKLDGVPIINTKNLSDLFEKNVVSDFVFASKCQNPEQKQEIIDLCLNHNIKVKTIPDVNLWINGELSANQIRKINIEDLLERPQIVLNEKEIKKDILNKKVLVTGAAGSIGQEIVFQLTKFQPEKIIIFDQAESPLYDLELELYEKTGFYNFEIVIGDITNPIRMSRVFEVFKPDIVFHAAAYKHVPMMENNPSEAIVTNVYGTKVIADLSVKHGVSKFVMISTDKAVNPTNVMGASKRIAEIYTQTLNRQNKTKFITTRFGNVLGSNGSVIPRFRKQIETGGPVTVTHPEVTRFFMTIPEACQLVLQACALGNGGEIFIFDMGKSVKIVDLAKKMIKLSGLEIGKDIHLNYSGLRPGEKLYEELLNDHENTIATNHEKIMVAKVREYEPEVIIPEIEKLFSLVKTYDNFQIVNQMKVIVPEFSSKNSIYEALDNKISPNLSS